MNGDSGLVWITFTTDFEFRNNAVSYNRGSRCLVDPATAAALVLVGAAVKDTPSAVRGT